MTCSMAAVSAASDIGRAHGTTRVGASPPKDSSLGVGGKLLCANQNVAEGLIPDVQIQQT
jgi:hypothetical protein